MVRDFCKIIVAMVSALATMSLSTSIIAQGSASQPLFEYSAINHPVMGRSGMVASHNVLSSKIAAEILSNGGNAIDAGAGAIGVD